MNLTISKYFEVEEGIVFGDDSSYFGLKNGELYFFQGDTPLINVKSFISHFFKVDADYERVIHTNHQHINVDGFEIEGQLTINGQLVV